MQKVFLPHTPRLPAPSGTLTQALVYSRDILCLYKNACANPHSHSFPLPTASESLHIFSEETGRDKSLYFLSHGHHQSQVREVAKSGSPPSLQSTILGNSYWLLLKDIFWNFHSTRLKFDLDIGLSASTIQEATRHFSGIFILQLVMSCHLAGSRALPTE